MKNSIWVKFVLLFISVCLLLSFAACDKGGNNDVTTDAPDEQTTESKGTDAEDTETETETEAATDLILGDDVAYAAEFTVSKAFGDNMVIQRNEYIRIWGWAEESENGKKVSASYMGATADALITDGAWEVIIHSKLEANTEKGNDLKVYTDSKEVVFKDVLVGDVFMVIGQSNIQYSVSQYLNNEPEKKWSVDELSADSIIRMNYNSNTDSTGYPVRGTTDVCEDVVTPNGWVIPDKNNVMRLSAFGYFVAKQVADLTENKIPIGIIQISANGRPLSVFMPNELADSMKTDQFDESQGIYIGKHHTHVVTRYMYNHYMKPYERMPLAGVVWYQGEAESAKAVSSVFVERFSALMSFMRDTHNLVNKEFPVFVMELPTIYSKPADFTGEWGYLDTGVIRAVQGMIPMSLANSYIAVGSDLWKNETHADNVHPYCKYEQAERMSALMDAVLYGGKTMDEAAGPVLASYEISTDQKTIVLKFNNVGEGLTTSDGTNVIKGLFSVNKKYAIEKKYEVVAEITAPDTITVTCERAMCGVAYIAHPDDHYDTTVNLCDSYGNPVAGFFIYEFNP